MSVVRSGHEPGFLGENALVLPPVAPAGVEVVRLDHVHFTVWLRPDRGFAAATCVDIDGSALVDLPRAGIDWRLDPRVADGAQTGPALYAGNRLDRGHLVRRRDPCWGSDAVARAANADTFTYPNAAPQVAVLNQSDRLWLGLEDYLLGAADAADQRLVVLTGPVLAADDPHYRGRLLPRAFWKIAAWATPGGSLASTGYLLDQGDLLDAVLRAEAPGQPTRPQVGLDLGAYRTFQVPVAEIAARTGLDLGELPGADRLLAPARPAAARSRELRGYADVVLG